MEGSREERDWAASMNPELNPCRLEMNDATACYRVIISNIMFGHVIAIFDVFPPT